MPAGRRLHRARDLQDPFKADAFHHSQMSLRRQIRIDRYLDEAIAVAQIKENHAAMVAATMHPAGHGYLLTSVGRPEFTASVCTMHACLHVDCRSVRASPCLFPHHESRVLDCILAGHRPDKNNRPSQLALGDWVGRARLRQMAVLRPEAVLSPSFAFSRLRAT